MSATLNYLLAHKIARNEELPQAVLDVVELLLTVQPIQTCELEEGTAGPVMKRWSMRMLSLVAPSLPVEVRSAGWQLLTTTFVSSPTSLLANTKASLPLALSAVSQSDVDPHLYAHVVTFLTVVAATSLRHNEWAKEHVTAQTVQKMVQNMHARAVASPRLLEASVEAIVRLISLFPTALRPLYQTLHDLSASLLAADSEVSQQGAKLFAHLYLLAPKGREGLQDAWRKSVESLVGAAHALLPLITGDVLVENAVRQDLPPLSLALPASGEVAALRRLETILECITLVLQTPTSERVGTVPVPAGALVDLGVRLVSYNTEAPVRDRQDPTLVTLVKTLLPRLQTAGCSLLAQLAMATGPRLLGLDRHILDALSSTLLTYGLRSPMRASLASTYAVVLSSLGAGVDPNEAQRSLARVWRCTLEDIGAVALQEQAAPATSSTEANGSRKKKRQRTYDPSEDLNKKGAAVSDEVLANAQHGLHNLAQLARCPLSHFLAPQLRLAAARLVLTLAMEPEFFSSYSRSAKSTLFLSGSIATPVDAARQSVDFRRRTVECLAALVESSTRMPGLVEKAIYVWRRAVFDSDEQISSMAKAALRETTLLMHPALPPMQRTAAVARQEHEQVGGDLGHEEHFADELREFAPQAVTTEEHEPDDVADGDTEMQDTPEVQPPSILKPTTAFGSAATTTNGFSTNAFSFAKPPEVPTQDTMREAASEAAPVPVATMTTERSVPVVAAKGAQTVAKRTAEADESSDEEHMPDIHLSDNE